MKQRFFVENLVSFRWYSSQWCICTFVWQTLIFVSLNVCASIHYWTSGVHRFKKILIFKSNSNEYNGEQTQIQHIQIWPNKCFFKLQNRFKVILLSTSNILNDPNTNATYAISSCYCQRFVHWKILKSFIVWFYLFFLK